MNKHKWLVNLCLGFVKLTGLLPALIFLKPRIYLANGAKRKLPKSCILVSNHISLMDFVLYLLVFPFQTIRFLIAEVLYNRNGFLRVFLNLIGGIRVEREAKSFDFVSHALSVLDDGGKIGVFPQGRLPLKGQNFPFTVSTAFIAMHTDAPIIPVYTDGNYGLFKRTTLVIGPAIYLNDCCEKNLDEQAQLAHSTGILEKKVYALKVEIDHDANKRKNK